MFGSAVACARVSKTSNRVSQEKLMKQTDPKRQIRVSPKRKLKIQVVCGFAKKIMKYVMMWWRRGRRWRRRRSSTGALQDPHRSST